MGSELNGLLVIDKPAKMTSARLVAAVKKTIGVKKIGHTGTLDPFATGVMVLCLGRATRLARFFLHGDKHYRAVMVLGKETDTLDGTGTVIASSDEIPRSVEEIDAVMRGFLGRQRQSPPVYSALKHKGTPLYKLARRGTPVQKPPREVVIRAIQLIAADLPAVTFDVACSSGTYIRSLCSDIGRSMGCGAYLRDLRRTRSGAFAIDRALSPAELEALARSGKVSDQVISPAKALDGMSTRVADPELVAKVRHGQALDAALIEARGFIAGRRADFDGFAKIEDTAGNLLAVVEKEKRSGQYRYCCVFY